MSPKREGASECVRNEIWLRVRKWAFFANDPSNYLLFAVALLALDAIVQVLIIRFVPYTEIDWIAYMQEVEGVLSGEFDYAQLRGDTGPLVYPAGFVYLFAVLRWITDSGRDILRAQIIFACVHLALIALVFAIYARVRLLPPWALVLLMASRRIHSIFALRLFNDCFAMLFLYAAILLFLSRRWSIGCFVFSLAVSVKMNVLLFAPPLLLLLLKNLGVMRTVLNLCICASLQFVLAMPFLAENATSYMMGAFDFGRKFFFKWTVNLHFLPEHVFTSTWLAVFLLGCHVSVLILFATRRWCLEEGGLMKAAFGGTRKGGSDAQHFVSLMFVGNLIGVVFARSLHYQFYVWYYHTLPHLLWLTAYPLPVKLGLLAAIEVVWNVYPPRASASLVLVACHALLLWGVWSARPVPASRLRSNKQL